MAVQILSDLHLEAPKAYDTFEIVPNAPFLALLGDIGNVVAHKDDCLAFLRKQLGQFRAVLFVAGNHEAYHSSWPDALDVLRAFEVDVRRDASLGEFVLLDRAVYRLPGTNVTILGCSLFSLIPPERHMAVSLGLNDFFQTTDWDADAHNAAHRRDVAWLNDQVAHLEHADDGQVIIFTHWSPSRDARATEPRHAGSPITSGFSTDLSHEACFNSERVKIWAFGHTHYNCDFSVDRGAGAGPLRLLANQRGYYFAQADGYDGEKTVEV
ncbi:Uncharacterized protein TCAP_02514 [Tolypocladium capitatum]|uniref:Calcineurin-like phosphoesterase domain-containing protein n=1 Tax=Tolypocladium capitatum TaxID=45235 RepID=A0A2K3QJ44_9HYPO|nr:Uncharacterized protein TCAP_02514 [Tolypocladium capitatum]